MIAPEARFNLDSFGAHDGAQWRSAAVIRSALRRLDTPCAQSYVACIDRLVRFGEAWGEAHLHLSQMVAYLTSKGRAL